MVILQGYATLNRLHERRQIVRQRISAAGAQIIEESEMQDGFGATFYRFHVIPGILVQVYDAGKITVGVIDPRLLSGPDRQLVQRLRRLLAPFLPL